MARWLGVTPSSVIQRVGGKARVLEIIVGRFGDRWLDWAAWPCTGDGLRLSTDECEIHAVRVWQALAELASGAARAGNPALEQILSHVRAEEQGHLHRELGQLLDRSPDVGELATMSALGVGLRAELAVAHPRLSTEQAQALIRAQLAAMRRA